MTAVRVLRHGAKLLSIKSPKCRINTQNRLLCLVSEEGSNGP